jgi:holo-[acyl-carrier protein] synthase
MTVVAGIDIQNIDEVDDALSHFGDRYLRKLFSDPEIDECTSMRRHDVEGLAARFAAKEAVIKVLRPYDHIPSWRSIEVHLEPSGPMIVLHGEAKEMANRVGLGTMSLSVSVAREYAIAAVVATLTGPCATGGR